MYGLDKNSLHFAYNVLVLHGFGFYILLIELQ